MFSRYKRYYSSGHNLISPEALNLRNASRNTQNKRLDSEGTRFNFSHFLNFVSIFNAEVDVTNSFSPEPRLPFHLSVALQVVRMRQTTLHPTMTSFPHKLDLIS